MTGKTKYGQGNTRQRETDCDTNFNSPAVLANIIVSFDFTDIWRENNVLVKQFTWVKVNEGRISAARLDRLYVLNNMKNRVIHTAIIPTYCSDHKLITVDFTLTSRKKKVLIGILMKSYCKTQVFVNPLNIFGKHGKV